MLLLIIDKIIFFIKQSLRHYYTMITTRKKNVKLGLRGH